MAQTNHGSIEFLKFPNPLYPGDNTRMIKKWLRDSWSRRKIAALQSQLSTLQANYTALEARVAALEGNTTT